MAKANRTVNKARSGLHLVLQQGGSTAEWYAKLFNTSRDAKAHVRSCAGASYKTTAPVRLPKALTAALLASPDVEAEFLDILQVAVEEAVGIA